MAVNPIPKDSTFRIQHKLLLELIESNDASKRTDIHPHQQEALLRIKNRFDDENLANIALVVLPTGCGKTGVAVLAPFVLDSHRVLVLTPSNAISDQIFKAFAGEASDMFLVQRKIANEKAANHVRPSCTQITKTNQIERSLYHELLIVTAHQVAGNSRVKIEDIVKPENYDLVIVDEAHHYPASTWKTIINYFRSSKRLFLTATPHHSRTGYILNDISPDLVGLVGTIPTRINVCYRLTLQNAISSGIIRKTEFVEVGTSAEVDELFAMQAVSLKIVEILQKHDAEDSDIRHQAMVLTQTVSKGGTNSAEDFCQQYNEVAPLNYHCEKYVANSSNHVLEKFQNGVTRTLVIVEKLREGYDNTNVSVVAIVRNVQPKSRVLFSQFVGRAIRKAHPDDPVTTAIIAHKLHDQEDNYKQFDQVVDEDVILDE